MPGFIKEVLENFNIEIDRKEFPWTLPCFKGFHSLELDPKVTFFIGENGSGKSTLLEVIAINYGLPPEGGTKWHSFKTYDTHSPLMDQILLNKGIAPADSMFLRAETFYNMASYLETQRATRFSQLHSMSRGESFLATASALITPGLFIFDEPESALSINGLLRFLVEMQRLVEEGSQLIIATHSPILLGFGQGKILEFSTNGIHEVKYKETKQYQLTLDFLRNRERYVTSLGLTPDKDEE